MTTRDKCLKAGLKLWPNVTAVAVGKAVGLTHSAVLYHFQNNSLKDAVAAYAVERGDKRVMAQLIVSRHKAVKGLSAEDKREILESV